MTIIGIIMMMLLGAMAISPYIGMAIILLICERKDRIYLTTQTE